MPAPLLLVCLIALAGDPPPTDWPPKPDFEHPVDYVAWYNAFVCRGKKPPGKDPYEGFTPQIDKEGNWKGGMPKPDERILDQFKAGHPRPWKKADHPDLAAFIEKAGPFLEKFIAATHAENVCLTIPRETRTLFNVVFPDISPYRNAAKCLLAMAWMKQEDQAVKMRNAHVAILRNAGHVQRHDTLICGMTGMAQRSLAYNSTRAAFHHKILTAAAAMDIYKELKSNDPGAGDYSRQSAVECALVLEAIQSGCPHGKWDMSTWKQMLAARSQDKEFPPDAERRLEAEDPRRSADAISEQFQWQARLMSTSISYQSASRLRKQMDELRKSPDTPMVLLLLATGMGRVCELEALSESNRRATLLTVALHAHRHKHGQWPKRLEDIDRSITTPKELETVRIDPVAGKPFHYELKDGQPLLYSLGIDGNDDGGKHDPKFGQEGAGGDFVYWPYQSD